MSFMALNSYEPVDTVADTGDAKVEYGSFFEEWNQFIELKAKVGTGKCDAHQELDDRL
jgi:hypothetical protein